MILLTGAAGFIGSCLLAGLNDMGVKDIVVVDDFSDPVKNRNLENKKFLKKIHRDQLFDWLASKKCSLDFVFHIGARTDTTLQNRAIFHYLNLQYSKKIWQLCTQFGIPLLYASSAATYGLGKFGFVDDHSGVHCLEPLNLYAISKNDFDKWCLRQKSYPPFWAGFKFFNVYGPNEYHKDRMASVVFHAFRQIKATGQMKLFRSHRPDFRDGEQSRDFVYVKDVVRVLSFFFQSWLNRSLQTEQDKSEGIPQNGLYNLGTGYARTFYDLVARTFLAMNVPLNISYIDTPADIRETYQYFTEAPIGKLRKNGYKAPFNSLEQGVSDYVQQYLMAENYL